MYNGFLTNLYNPVTINSFVGVKGIGVPLPINTKLPEQKMYITTPNTIGTSPRYRNTPMSKWEICSGDKRILCGIQIKKNVIIINKNNKVPNKAGRISAILDFISLNL